MRQIGAEDGGPDEDLDYEDTVALLQEEVARLEAELRLRDEAIASPLEPSPADGNPIGEDSEGRIAALTAELTNRDETIELLWAPDPPLRGGRGGQPGGMGSAPEVGRGGGVARRGPRRAGERAPGRGRG